MGESGSRVGLRPQLLEPELGLRNMACRGRRRHGGVLPADGVDHIAVALVAELANGCTVPAVEDVEVAAAGTEGAHERRERVVAAGGADGFMELGVQVRDVR